ncbi:MAG TPA: radical SAM protein [Chitinophagaceae bacterium]|nr:radical SAM protein [Chitinophagaceae bacterium]
MDKPHQEPLAVITAELFTIPLEDGKYVIYAPLRQAAFVGNTSMVNFLADLAAGFYNKNLDPNGSLLEFLSRLEIVNASPEQLPITTFENDPFPTAVSLFLTTACNLRCTYCYASAGDTPLRNMSADVAKRGIDFILANALKKGEQVISIAYHGGGEPTVNWKVMTASLSYAREASAPHGIDVVAASASNGVLTDQQIDWIIENLNSVTLSFDGLPEVHDLHRPTVTGKGSSGKVIHTMQRFDKAGFNYGVRVTATADQIPQLAASIEFICSHFNPVRIQVEPAYQMGRWRTAPSAETAAFIESYRIAQSVAGRYGKEISFSAARVGSLSNHFCGITQDSFCLTTDGQVSACYETFMAENEWSKVFFYGKPDPHSNGYQFNIPVLNNLRGQAVQHRGFCNGCFAKWTCGGDCYHKSLTVNGQEEFQGSDRCHIIRELTKDQLLQKIHASGGLFWHQMPADVSSTAPSAASGKELLFGP